MKFSGIQIMATAACLVTAVLPLSAQEQPGPGKGEQQKITLHISKEVNGKTTVFDTTFTDPGNFDVDTFLEERGLGSERPGDLEKDIRKELKIVIPRMDDEMFSFRLDSLWPDTLDLSGNIHIFKQGPGDYRFEWKDYPDLKFDWNWPEFEEPFRQMIPGDPGNGRECPYGPNWDPGRCYRYDHGFPFNGDHDMKIKKKRHGRKIVIRTFEDEDAAYMPRHRRHGEVCDSPRESGAGRSGVNREKKIIIEREMDPSSGGGKTEKKVIILRGEDDPR